ncbi:hypothetical protein K504DRAFT_503650 [Pleomassaria siparia CBS 279.74]|uniref:Uncharacterized protein n=1 Tax=Pleomassaria siparia CBS 279.74 TaxID=1314801 RepID=A0A6G1K6H6_9PLEO|nr:hypothetical protein K504DRAFT_503650 [Pleomassaria siparia CBS 279.74]
MKSTTIFTGLTFVAGTAASAIPTPILGSEASIVHSTFSFVDWVNSIMVDSQTAPSPEEAIEAFTANSLASRMSTFTEDMRFREDEVMTPTYLVVEKRQTFGSCQQITE